MSGGDFHGWRIEYISASLCVPALALFRFSVVFSFRAGGVFGNQIARWAFKTLIA